MNGSSIHCLFSLGGASHRRIMRGFDWMALVTAEMAAERYESYSCLFLAILPMERANDSRPDWLARLRRHEKSASCILSTSVSPGSWRWMETSTKAFSSERRTYSTSENVNAVDPVLSGWRITQKYEPSSFC